MASLQIKRISLPRTWKIPRKSFQRKKEVFVSKPNAGKDLEFTLPLNNFIKDSMKKASTKKEVKMMIKYKNILVNGKKVKDEKFPVGLFDVVEFKEAEQFYRLSLNSNGKLTAIEIPSKEKDILVSKIMDKKHKKQGMQISLFNGYNQVLKEKTDCKVGDSVVLKSKKVQKVLELKEGAFILIAQGRHIGKTGVAKKIEGTMLHVEMDGKEVETVKDYAYVLGEKKPEITITN
ncbi:MAG: S4 domain-containing protein [Nanobdellota archaeon]